VKRAALAGAQATHAWHGCVSDAPLASLGDLSSITPATNENHGLWTSLAVAAASLHYAATGDPKEKDRAAALFDGIAGLTAVTGIVGFPARTFANATDARPYNHWGWHESPVPEYEGWWFLGNTSSDETTGHLFAMPLYAELAADPARKETATQLHCNLTENMVTHGFTLPNVDPSEPTLWGQWQPEKMNGQRSSAEEHGVNSLQMLAYVLSAHRLCPSGQEAMFAEAFDTLIAAGYASNMVNCQLSDPETVNYSDINLTWLAYYTLHFACRADGLPDSTKALCNQIREPLVASAERTYRITTDYGGNQAFHNYIYGAITGAAGGSGDEAWRAEALRSLEQYPLEIVKWSLNDDPSKRIDITINQDLLPDLVNSRVPLDLGSTNEINTNSNTKHTVDNGDGMSARDMSTFLLGLGMGEYHGFV